MKFTLYHGDVAVGWSELPYVYPLMNAVSGPFHADENFERIRAVFHQHHLNDGTYGGEDEIDEAALEAARQAIQELNLTVRAETGESLDPSGGIMVSINDAYPDHGETPLFLSLTEVPYELFEKFWAEQAAEFWANHRP